MWPKSMREAMFVVFTASACVILAYNAFPSQAYENLVIAATAAFIFSSLGLVFSSILTRHPSKTDIWAYQRELMRVSGQHIPQSPQINKDVFLYYALIMEEMAETSKALCTALKSDNTFVKNVAGKRMHDFFEHLAQSMSMQSQGLRNQLTDVYACHIPLSKTHAEEILDGATDVAVTVAGFGLALGMPVELAYHEVASSNLSKVNPITGVIDKDYTGKWIKGPKYRSPDLGRVLSYSWINDDEK